ncbi:hypothetical protein IWW34DRAFT_791196 [Fusarium oxysporum f. sp. albedinis]|nr:hypothetical protein IWW34DRAFT_791196 [Fusarium oxysporum f. sp. albedinis]
MERRFIPYPPPVHLQKLNNTNPSQKYEIVKEWKKQATWALTQPSSAEVCAICIEVLRDQDNVRRLKLYDGIEVIQIQDCVAILEQAPTIRDNLRAGSVEMIEFVCASKTGCRMCYRRVFQTLSQDRSTLSAMPQPHWLEQICILRATDHTLRVTSAGPFINGSLLYPLTRPRLELERPRTWVTRRRGQALDPTSIIERE